MQGSNGIERLKEIIKNSDKIVFLGGAGVSTESGIPDFRSSDGLYSGTHKIPPEVILSHTYFNSHTKEFYDYYKNNMIYKDAKPNKAHYALQKLEEQGKLIAVITQNIDGLHSLAGSKKVIEIHGTVLKNKCTKCGAEYSLDYVLSSDGVPKCTCGGTVKPEVVLYEESLDEKAINDSLKAITTADTLIVGGTSLTVNPAASLVNYFNGKNFVIINKTATPYDDYATLIIRDKIGEVLESVTED